MWHHSSATRFCQVGCLGSEEPELPRHAQPGAGKGGMRGGSFFQKTFDNVGGGLRGLTLVGVVNNALGGCCLHQEPIQPPTNGVPLKLGPSRGHI